MNQEIKSKLEQAAEKYEIESLQTQNERYRKALERIAKEPDYLTSIWAKEALKQEEQ